MKETLEQMRLKWLERHASFDSDECLYGPFNRNHDGYAFFTVRQDGKMKTVYAARLMCEHRNGPPPSPAHHAAHSCGNGHLGCINPGHLSWKTAAENQHDRYEAEGGKMPKQRLTHEQVEEIRALKGKEHKLDTAARFGVTPRTIWSIQTGILHNGPMRRILTDDEVREIRKLRLQVPSPKLGKQYGVSANVIQNVWKRETYQYVEDKP